MLYLLKIASWDFCSPWDIWIFFIGILYSLIHFLLINLMWPKSSETALFWTDSAQVSYVCIYLVTYWPSTELSIKRRNRCIQSSMLEYHLDTWTWLNLVQMHTPTGSRWVSNNYITRCHRQLGLSVWVRISSVPVGVSWGIRCQHENQLADWGLATLSDPQLSSTARMRKKCCYGRKNFGSICSNLSPSPTHFSHTRNINPFKNEVWEVYFYKKCVRSFIEVRHCVWLCFCLYYVYVCSYTTT